MPPPAAQNSLDRVDVARRVHRLDQRAHRPPADSRTSQPEPVARLQLLLDRGDPRRALGVRAGVVLAATTGGAARADEPSRVPYPAHEPTPPQLHADVAVVGAGAAGPVRRADRRGARARASCSSPRRRSRGPRATGPRAGSPRRSRPTTRPTCTATTPRSPGAASCARRPPRVLCREAPRDRRRPRARSACASTPTATATSRSASRAATPGAASCTPAAARPAGASCASCRRSSPRTGASTSSSRRAPRRSGSATGAASASSARTAARSPRAASSSPPAAPPRCGRARRTRRARVGIGAAARAARAGAALADLELIQFHPTAVTGVPGREGFLVTEAIRGEGATLLDPDGERFVEELAPRDEVARAIDAKMRETGTTHVWLDMRAIDPAHFPNVVAALHEAGLDPTHRARPGRARGALRDGRRRDRPRRRDDGAGPVRRRRVRVHRAARRQPARVELAERVLRASASARRSRRSPSRRCRRAPTRRRPRRSRCPTRETREPLWRDAGLVRDRGGPARRCSSDPHPLARIVAQCALLREESRGAHQRSDFPATDPALDGHHAVVRDRDAPVFEAWV